MKRKEGGKGTKGRGKIHKRIKIEIWKKANKEGRKRDKDGCVDGEDGRGGGIEAWGETRSIPH